MNHTRTTAPYRIGWWTHRWWPTRAILVGAVTGNQPSPRADNGSRFVGRRVYWRLIVRDLGYIRRPHRPWQSEALGGFNARRGFTAAGAERKMLADVARQVASDV